MLRKIIPKNVKTIPKKEMIHVLGQQGCPIPCHCDNCGTYEISRATFHSNSARSCLIDKPT